MSQPGAGVEPDQPLPTRVLVLAMVRVAATVGALLALYFTLPLGRHMSGGDLTGLVLGLCLFLVLVVLQVGGILRAEYPGIRAVESLANLVPLWLVIFATYYYVLDSHAPGSFNNPLTKLDSLYFTVTVFATVGFGDIVATTQAARTAVLLQMIGNLLVLGVLLKVVLGAREKGLARKKADADGDSEEPGAEQPPSS